MQEPKKVSDLTGEPVLLTPYYSRGRTRTYDPRVMSPMSCQLLYPASNALVIMPVSLINVNRIRGLFSYFSGIFRIQS